jgi:hypothetical protein
MTAFPAGFILDVEWQCWKELYIRNMILKRSEKRNLTTDVACRADLVIADRSNHELSKYSLSWFRHVTVKKLIEVCKTCKIGTGNVKKVSWLAICYYPKYATPCQSPQTRALYLQRTNR